MNNWFEIDKEGLAAIKQRDGKTYVLLELYSNACDTDATEVYIALTPLAKRNRARLVITDDDPNGFADLTHAYTLFAPSTRIAQAEKRGRFNLGEKLVLALCDSASVTSTKGAVHFKADGTRTTSRAGRRRGTVFEAVVKMNRTEVEEALTAFRSVIPPIPTFINGERLPERVPIARFDATLRTVGADMRPTRRKTEVQVFEPGVDLATGEHRPAWLYELGIPVVETEDRWSVNVMQKVPLNMDRDNVTPAYLREVRVAVMNQMYRETTHEDATSTWGREALGDPDVVPEAVQHAVEQRFTKRAVVFDPTDPEANNLAVSKGYHLVYGKQLNKAEWEQVRKVPGLLRPAGQVTPSNSTVLTSPDGVPEIPAKDWTPTMRAVATYAKEMAKHLIQRDVHVEFHQKLPTGGGECAGAAFGGNRLLIAMSTIRNEDAEHEPTADLDALLIHEFAHEYATNHLDHSFYDATCRLGARFGRLRGSILHEAALKIQVDAPLYEVAR